MSGWEGGGAYLFPKFLARGAYKKVYFPQKHLKNTQYTQKSEDMILNQTGLAEFMVAHTDSYESHIFQLLLQSQWDDEGRLGWASFYGKDVFRFSSFLWPNFWLALSDFDDCIFYHLSFSQQAWCEMYNKFNRIRWITHVSISAQLCKLCMESIRCQGLTI